MKNQIKTMASLKDSRIMFDKEPPAFGYIIILIVGAFLVAAIVWSIKTPKIYTIQSQGTVTSIGSNYVMSSYTGEIETSYMKEGMLVEEGDVLFTVRSTDYDLQEQQLLESRIIYENQIRQYELLVESIKDDVNYFDSTNPDDDLYYNIFEIYKAQIAQNTIDVSTYKAYGYTDEQIEAEVIKNQAKLSELYYTALQSAESAIEEADKQIKMIDAQLSAIDNGQISYEVRANSTGVLHLLADYKEGMVVQTATSIATITPENGDRVIEAYVSTADMARIKEGDSVQIVVDGLSQSVYGSINGNVIHIDSNVTVQQSNDGNTTQSFKILVKMDQDYVVSKSGDMVEITNGMTAVARIQYDKVTYFNYVIEKMGFK